MQSNSLNSFRPKTPGSLKEISTSLLQLHIASIIWLIIIQLAISNRPGKLYWIINLFSIVPNILLVTFYYKCYNRETNLRIKLMPLYATIDTVVHFMYLIEVLFVSLQNVSTDGSIGTFWGLIPSVIIFGLFLYLLWSS